jgi:hypothetical protein
MRIVSGENKGAEHWSGIFKGKPVVAIDGEIVPNVLEADDVAGYAIALVPREPGLFVASAADLVEARLEGKVVITGERL